MCDFSDYLEIRPRGLVAGSFPDPYFLVRGSPWCDFSDVCETSSRRSREGSSLGPCSYGREYHISNFSDSFQNPKSAGKEKENVQ